MTSPEVGDQIAVWFSCGAASAVALKKTVERYGSYCYVRAINNPVAEEDEDNRRFLKDVERWVGVEIESAINPRYPSASAVDVWDRRKAMSLPVGAPCTVHLKREARQHWETANEWHTKPGDKWIVMGFTAEEQDRSDRFRFTERSNLLPVLIDQHITKEDCYQIVRDAGLELPRVYSMGYPNANCLGCVKASSPTYWNHVREQHPEVFTARAEQSRRIGSKLVKVKGQRIYLDELDPSTKGRPLKSMKAVECGIFCEERSAPLPKPKTPYPMIGVFA
jgi:hypothetical protein